MSAWVQVECASCGEPRLAWNPGDGVEPFDEACSSCGAEAYTAD